MILNGFWVFVGGMLGPLLMELVKIAAWRNLRKVSNYYRRPLYWVGTAALFVLGGAFAALNGTDHVPVLRALQLGIAAPAIIAGYATATPRRAGAMPDKKLVDLLSWS